MRSYRDNFDYFLENQLTSLNVCLSCLKNWSPLSTPLTERSRMRINLIKRLSRCQNSTSQYWKAQKFIIIRATKLMFAKRFVTVTVQNVSSAVASKS